VLVGYRHQSDTYIWLDAKIIGKGDAEAIRRSTVKPPAKPLKTPDPLWAHAWSTPVGRSSAGAAVTVEIECIVDVGSVGFVLERDRRFISREVIVEARTGSQRLYLSTTTYEGDVLLLTRNASALGPSRYSVTSIELRRSL
jgi:hypothetical protein